MKLFFNLLTTVSLVVGQFSAPINNRASSPLLQEPPTPTVTETVTATATETVTPTFTETLTPFAKETLTATNTPEITASPTETVTPALTGTPPSPSVTPVPVTLTAVSPALTPITLLLEAIPERLLKNEKTNLKWSIEGLDKNKEEDWVVQIKFPQGVTPDLDKTSTYDVVTNILHIPAKKMNGTLQIHAEQNVTEATIEAALLHNGEIIATAVLNLGSKEAFGLSQAGGEAQNESGRIKVKFPSGVLEEAILLEMGDPSLGNIPVYSLSSHPFELKAFGEESKRDLKKFKGKVTIEVDYTELELKPGQETDLYLYWYNPETQEWAALPSFADPVTKTLTAETDHFTVFDVGINNWQASLTPTIESFQVSEFTGAATYSFPIEVPPGPGGLQPSLSLAYNSQVVDQASVDTQASWVGMGWSLDIGSITIDTHGTSTHTGDDTYFLNVGGVSTRIVKDQSGVFHSEDENYWKMTFVGDVWTIQDQVGNTYTFGKQAKTRYPSGSCSSPSTQDITYKWMLTEFKNAHNQVLTYTYTPDEKTLTNLIPDMGCSVTYKVDTALYPSTINYPQGGYQIRFVLEPRDDFNPEWVTDAA